ncbi:reverse transcriptase/maturase family protein [Anaerolineales bacterium HSG25]|nr:reverse transcriptase/maturase family protein [Anaerolineales bacterium HSG25]
MTKQCYNLYPKIYNFTNLWSAFAKAAKGKRYRSPSVAEFEFNLEPELIQLEQELQAKIYQPGVYDNFVIKDPKRRVISSAPFRDRVVHHALMNIIEPLFERLFIHDSYANRVGKGTHKALDRCTYYLRRYRYVMHCDIQQYFPSIDHQVLRQALARTIGDEQVMALIDKILASGEGIQTEMYRMVYFAEDDLFAGQRLRGLPIGNLTSQHWANVYLNQFDHYVKRTLKCRAYIRYVDDFLLFADDKSTLHQWRAAIITFLADLRLTLHESRAQPRPVSTGVPFLGFTVFPDHRRLKRYNGYAFQRRFRQLVQAYHAGEISREQLEASLKGWINHVCYGDTWGLRRSILGQVRLLGTVSNG